MNGLNQRTCRVAMDAPLGCCCCCSCCSVSAGEADPSCMPAQTSHPGSRKRLEGQISILTKPPMTHQMDIILSDMLVPGNISLPFNADRRAFFQAAQKATRLNKQGRSAVRARA